MGRSSQPEKKAESGKVTQGRLGRVMSDGKVMLVQGNVWQVKSAEEH